MVEKQTLENPLFVLILEDNEDDALLMVRELKKYYNVQSTRVDERSAFISALDRDNYDLILADYALPNLTGLEALRVYKEKELLCPFILISGNVGEETAATVMREGASDFVLKSNLSRLEAIVRRELREYQLRLEKEWLEDKHILSTEILQLLNAGNHDDSTITRDILTSFQAFTGANSIGLRLKMRNDMLYTETLGYEDTFLDQLDEINYMPEDPDIVQGLSCLCSNVLYAQTSKTPTCTTANGSFWTNNLEELHASLPPREREDPILHAYLSEGYLSMAIIPLRAKNEIVGALELCDFTPHLFSPAVIQFFEELGVTIGISLAHREAIKTLKESQERLSLHIKQTPLAVIEWNLNFEINEWNTAAEQIFGYPRDEALNKQAPELLCSDDNRSSVCEFWSELMKTKEATTATLTNARKNGEQIACQWFITPIVEESGHVIGIAALAQDITEHRKAESDLAASEERFRMVTECAPAAIMMYRNDSWVYANPAAEEMTGYTTDELSQMAFWEFIHPEDREWIKGMGRARQLGKAPRNSYNTRILTKKGEERWIQIKAAKLANQRENTVLVSALDITPRKEAEKKQQQIESKMQETQKYESLGLLAGGIAHDFNNLLTTILGNAELVMSEISPDSPVHESLSDIVKASNQASSLCREMLDYSGKGENTFDAVNLSDIVSDMLSILRVSVHKNTRLRPALRKRLIPVDAVPSQLRQIAMNLVSNANEAFENGEGEIKITTGMDKFSAAQLDSALFMTEPMAAGAYPYLQISDNGPGIDETTRKKMFEPFFSTKSKGRGLGMAAVAGILKTHRAALLLETEAGKGTTFTIVFKAAKKRARKPSNSRNGGKVDERDLPANVTGKTVLVIDDESYVLLIAQRMLKKYDITPLTAASGDKALQILRDQIGKIDCVVLDLNMPGMDGTVCFKEIRKLSKTLPIIVTSGYSKLYLAERFREMDVAGFIEKPFRTTVFIDTVSSALEQNEQTVV